MSAADEIPHWDLREHGAFAIGVAVALRHRGRRVVGIVTLYRASSSGRLYTVKDERDGTLIFSIHPNRLTAL